MILSKKRLWNVLDTEHGRTDKEKIAELEKQIELEKAKKPGYWELFAAFYYKDLNIQNIVGCILNLHTLTKPSVQRV